MDKILGVSWPRSGHHLLVRLLQLYFGPEFSYCDFYGGVEGCCKTAPCTRPDIHFTKSHDFELNLPQIPGQKYLIQYRSFLPSVVSNYELHLLSNPNEPDTADTFYRFASSDFSHYSGFMDKWVHSEFGQGQQLLSYEQLLEWPEDSLRVAVLWFAPDQIPDDARIARAIQDVTGEKVEKRKVEKLENTGIHSERDITQFRHYRPERFKQLETLKLTRAAVIGTFRDLLGRDPGELNMLNFQSMDSVDALAEHLRESEEYSQRMQT